MTASWFDVDKSGLAKLVERRGLGWVLFELVANGWDERGVRNVQVDFVPEDRLLIVGDDAPDGFHDLSHAWTLFAQSKKAGNDRQRGRFNLGEKLVLALAERADVVTTTGAVRFDGDGRHKMRERTLTGSVVRLTFKKLTKAQCVEIETAAKMLIPPEGVSTRFNGVELARPVLVSTVSAVLPTEVADEDGVLRRSARSTVVRVHEPVDGPGFGWVYEQGIPVVHTDDRYSYDVIGKVPLTLERDNVPPAFLRKVRAAALGVVFERLAPGDGSAPWVRDAAGAPEVSASAFTAAIESRFGAKRVMVDPSDREAVHRAALDDATVVHGNQLSEGERNNLSRFRADGVDPITPAGQSTYQTRVRQAGDAISLNLWTDRMIELAQYAEKVATACRVLGKEASARSIAVEWRTGAAFSGSYGSETLSLYKGAFDHSDWWKTDSATCEAVTRLLLHEFAHESESSHEGRAFAEAGFRLGSRLAVAVAEGRLDLSKWWEVK